MFENRFPYTDFHELNLDWILSELKQFRTDFYDNLLDTIVKYLNQILPNVIYDKNNENITLQVIADLKHSLSQELQNSPVVTLSNVDNDDNFVSIFTIGDLTIHVKDNESRLKIAELFTQLENLNNSFNDYKTKTNNDLLLINNNIDMIDKKLLDYVNLNEYLEKNNNNFDNAISEALTDLKPHGTLFIPLKDMPYESSNSIIITKPCRIFGSYEHYDVEEYTNDTSLEDYSKVLIKSSSKDCIIIKSIGVTLENLSILSSSTGTDSHIIKFSFENENSKTNVFRNIIFRNCSFIGTIVSSSNATNCGILCNETDMIVSSFENVWIYNCTNGVIIGNLTRNSTSLTFKNCWCINCITSGFNLIHCYYATFINCACDALNYCDYSYFLNKCKNVSLIGCGSEKTSYSGIIVDSSSEILLNCSLVDYNKNASPTGGGIRLLNSANITILDSTTFKDQTVTNGQVLFSNMSKFSIIDSNFTRVRINSETETTVISGNFSWYGNLSATYENCTVANEKFNTNGNSLWYSAILTCTGVPTITINGITPSSVVIYGLSSRDGSAVFYQTGKIHVTNITEGQINILVQLL